MSKDFTPHEIENCLTSFFNRTVFSNSWVKPDKLCTSTAGEFGWAKYHIIDDTSFDHFIGFEYKINDDGNIVDADFLVIIIGETARSLFTFTKRDAESPCYELVMNEYPPSFEDIISKETVKDFAFFFANMFDMTSKIRLDHRVNVVMADVIDIIKGAMNEVWPTSAITINVSSESSHFTITGVHDKHDYCNDKYGSAIDIYSSTIPGSALCIIEKIYCDSQSHKYAINIDPKCTNHEPGSLPVISIDKDGGKFYINSGEEMACCRKWQTTVINKLTKKYPVENETRDEKFKNRIIYIMDRVLDLLIDETKKVLNKNVVMVNCYESSNVNPSCLLGFKGVDISIFEKFICDCGSWDVRKSSNSSNNSSVTYYITWPRTGPTPKIIITRNGCKFIDGDVPRNTLMNSALPKIKELCESFNDDTPENKDTDKLVLNEGASVDDVIGSNMINKQTDHAFVFHGRQVTECVTAPSRYGLIDPRTNKVNEVAQLIYEAFVFAINEIAKEDNVPISHMPGIQESTWEWLFAYKNHDGDICLACIGDGDLDHYELWYRDPEGIKHVFMRLVVDKPGHITVYEGDRGAVTHISARAKVKVKALVDVYNTMEDFCKKIKSTAENHAFEYNKEEYKMNNKKNEEYMIQGIIPEFEFGKYYKKDGDEFVVVKDDKKWGTETVYTNEGSTLEPKYEKVEFSAAIATTIKDVIFDDPATTVLWTDGTKTTVKRMTTKYQSVITKDGGKEVPVERVPFDAEAALAAAIMNKMFGTHSKYAKFVKGYVVESENRKAAKKKKAAKKETAKKKKDSPCTEEKIAVFNKKNTTKKKKS